MISSFLPSKMLILLGISCLAWIGLLTAGITWFFHGSIPVGWLVAGGLFAALTIWFVVMLRELLRSVELPDYFAGNGRSTPGERRIAGIRRRAVMARISAGEQPSAIRIAPRPDRLVETRTNYVVKERSRTPR